MSIQSLGWNAFSEGRDITYTRADVSIARVTLQHKHLYRLFDGVTEWTASVSGRFANDAYTNSDWPTVGDWVAFSPLVGESKGVIHHIFPRKSCFKRLAAGNVHDAQVVSSNSDFIFLVHSMNRDWNVRRFERYLILARESGATPMVVFTKAADVADTSLYVDDVRSVCSDVSIFIVDSLSGLGVETLRDSLVPGMTYAMIGSSGVGKSTLTNALFGEGIMDTGAIRTEDSRGRHTTTHRELIVLPMGALLIDTPGMREVGLWADDDALDQTFSDVTDLFLQCKFSNCSHDSEPGCVVVRALNDGSLSTDRWQSYLK
ncbi:MAG: ribosome small subunit-dependent GTPase A, partial [Bacilli bacterium]